MHGGVCDLIKVVMVEGKQEITLTHTGDSGCTLHPGLKAALRHLLAEARRRRLPGLRLAAAVAEQPGRLSINSKPAWQPRLACDGVTVVSANLWHDFPRYRRQTARLEQFASLVESVNADVLLLQEVTRRPGLQADEWLARRLGMAHVYSRANGHAEIGFEEGLALLSRFPIGGIPFLRRLSQGCNPFVRRLALGAQVDTACGPIIVFSAHLALPRRQNSNQMAALQKWVGQLPDNLPVVVGGDFNAGEYSQPVSQLRKAWLDTFRERHPETKAVTHELRLPWGKLLSHRLDYIFLRPGVPVWDVVDVQHIDCGELPCSDHRAVVARLAPAVGAETGM